MGFLNKAVSLKVVFFLLLLVAIVPILSRRLWIDTRVPSAQNGLEISELIRRVKKGLEAANAEANAKQEAALFKAKTFDLEVTFVVEASTSSEGKTEYHLVTVDNTLEAKSERTQKITIHMDVVQPERIVKPAATDQPDKELRGVKVVGTKPSKKKEGIPPKKKEEKCQCEHTDHQ